MLTLVCTRLFSGRSATITTDARLQGPSLNVAATAKPEAQVHHFDQTPCQLPHYLPLISCYTVWGETSRAVSRGIMVNVGDVVLCVVEEQRIEGGRARRLGENRPMTMTPVNIHIGGRAGLTSRR